MTTDKDREGRCYELAAKFVCRPQEDAILIHGTAEIGVGGKRIKHAWVISDAGYIWEPVSDRWFEPDVFEKRFKPVVEHQYGRTEAFLLSCKNYGPWTDAERRRLRSPETVALLKRLEV